MSSVNEIAAKVSALEKMVSKLSVKSKGDKPPRNVTEKGIAHKAKILFYQDNKDNSAIKQKTKEVYGHELTVSFQNYPKLKKCTDSMYASLPTEEKDKYVIKAKQSVTSK